MASDDTVYAGLLIFSVLFGSFIKYIRGANVKRFVTCLVGVILVVIICKFHCLHSLIAVLVNCLLLKFVSCRYVHLVSYVWAFGYLALFRTIHYFGLPTAPPLSNAVQLFITLRLIGLAFEIHDVNKITDNAEENILLKKYTFIDRNNLWHTFSYSFCYIGLLTGPYYKYSVYSYLLHNDNSNKIPSLIPLYHKIKPLPIIITTFYTLSYYFDVQYAKTDEFYERSFWYRLFFMVPMFMIFRTRLYIAWILSECMCMTSTLGAFPVKAESRCGQGPTDLTALEDSVKEEKVEYDHNTVYNLDIYGCELAPQTKDGLKAWNKSVQYWLAAYVHKRVPIKSLKVSVTMAVSAYWHGIHPGYYLSFMTVPPILMAEQAMIKAFRTNTSVQQEKLFDWACWFFKMRGFDYMCMGFLLLGAGETLRYWSSIYYIAHVFTLLFFILGTVVNFIKPKPKSKSKNS
ncbi:hypothetical protein LOTGIDRAFT_155546 [Lottia gigantea]|uniref:Lysophospholipid acyltransferase 7 n=1 Tax=Lottia gigantea TaxID=225164 RepID=V3ZTH3_LOTGI|nr:hypothetical protein LOTGIDRAFT_155546 [Lottia gigantea]ESO84216.1 hypothetical protein LOTGIDRAFT_155546 [Lottia gigantea]